MGVPHEDRLPQEKMLEATNWEGTRGSGQTGLGAEKIKGATCTGLPRAADKTGG